MSAGTDDEPDPRVLRTRRIVLEAVLAELAEAGYGGFAVESVAARAHVGKSTIYRHWRGRIDLIADAMETLNIQPEHQPAATPQDDVVDLLTHLVEAVADSPMGACVPALIEAAERDQGVSDLLHRYSGARRAALRDAIARGMTAGAFPPRTDPDLAAQALAGAVFYRRLLTGSPFTTDEVPQLIATVLG